MKKLVYALLFIVMLAGIVPAFPRQADLQPGARLSAVTRLSMPGGSVTAEVATEGFILRQSQIRGDGQGRMILATNEGTGVVMSIYLVRAPRPGGAREARDYYWSYEQRGPLRVEDMRMGELDGTPVLEYTVREHQGVRIDQRHYRAFWVSGDVWIDMRLTKVRFKPEEERLFTSIVRSVRISG